MCVYICIYVYVCDYIYIYIYIYTHTGRLGHSHMRAVWHAACLDACIVSAEKESQPELGLRQGAHLEAYMW